MLKSNGYGHGHANPLYIPVIDRGEVITKRDAMLKYNEAMYGMAYLSWMP